MPKKASQLLLDHLDLLLDAKLSLPVLDLACGTGRNGLVLAHHGIPVVFADKSITALEAVKRHLSGNALPGQIWQVDLEQTGSNPLADREFSAIIGFNYLHRPIFSALKDSVEPGGLVIYETFTVENRRFGRPSNPKFLLRHGELKSIFQNWEIIFYFEGIQPEPARGIAQIVARRPMSPWSQYRT